MDKKTLEDLVNQKLTERQIGEVLGFSQAHIHRNLVKHGLRSKNEKDKRNKAICENCSVEFRYKGDARRFCSMPCSVDGFWKDRLKEFEENGKYPNSYMAKKHLRLTQGSVCKICGITEWLGKPAPLVCDHIDGNSENMSLDNFRLLCANCDAQTDTYKGKNKGKGRHFRRTRYANGQSY